MGNPSLDTFVKMNFQEEEDGADQIFEMAASCIKQIADPEQVYDCTDLPKTEVVEFIEGLTSAQFKNCLLYTSPSPRDQRGSGMPA